MAQDCEKLSENARKIFDCIKVHFPPGPWNKPNWQVDGMVDDNRWYDLRKSADRKMLIEKQKSMIGYLVELRASAYRKKSGSLDGFTRRRFSRHIQKVVELLLLLNDLDFKIETMMDIVEAPVT